jgi:integrase
MKRQQAGYIWKVGRSWFGRWRDDVIENGQVCRRQQSARLADVCDRFRTKADVRPLLVEKLRSLNEGKARPESTLPVADFVEEFYFKFIEENYKPSTIGGYKSLWRMYLSSRLNKIMLRDFRTVDAAQLLSDIHRATGLGRTTLKHIKSFLSGVFTFAKNQGVLDGMNPIHEAMIPKKAAESRETHATTPGEVLAFMDVLEKAGELKACAAVALMFFAGLRPGEARGARWEDLEDRRLRVRQSIWQTHTTSPKTKGSASPVPVIEPLASILVSLWAADGNPISGPLLRGPSGKALDLHNLARRIVVPTLTRCSVCLKRQADHKAESHAFVLDTSVPPWRGWYALRRGVATAVTALSTGSLAAKGLLRHSSVSTTERHYIKDVPDTTLQAMKRLEDLCGERRTTSGAKPS